MKNLDWIKGRIPFIRYIKEFLESKSVPNHKLIYFYLFGGLSLFLFLIQMVTGILLALYYSPTPENAHESIRKIMVEVEFGWAIRSIHMWGANLLVVVVLVHMFSVYFMKAYRRPREFMWFSGVIILFVVLGFAFTGYLLPWDTMGYFATQIGTEIPKSIPLVGETLIQLLRGEGEVAGEALKRMYVIHCIILPISILLLISFHLILQQFLGSSVPINTKSQGKSIPFLPNFLYRDFFAWTIATITIIGCSMMLPAGLGDKAEPLASAPLGIKPEWYFLPLYQTLRIFPTNILGLNGEMIVNTLVMLGSITWFIIPLLDKKAAREEKDLLFPLIGLLLILYCGTMIFLAYTT